MPPEKAAFFVYTTRLKQKDFRANDNLTNYNVPTLTKKTVQSLLISVPSMEVQKKTAEILDTLSPENSCTAIEKEIKERKKQFDILLHAMIGADF